MKPTVGRIVHFHGPDYGDKFLAAIVAGVVDDTHVNLTLFTYDGSYAGGQGNIELLEEAPEKPTGPFCIWPPRESGSMNLSPGAEPSAAEVEPELKPKTKAKKTKDK